MRGHFGLVEAAPAAGRTDLGLVSTILTPWIFDGGRQIWMDIPNPDTNYGDVTGLIYDAYSYIPALSFVVS